MIHLEILDEDRQHILKRLYKILGKDFYLAGGTALALQLKHRESLDFDLFRNEEITFSLKRKIFKEFKDYSIQTLVDTSDELSLVFNRKINPNRSVGVKVAFIAYWWGPIFPLIKIKGVIPLLSIKDIAATKAYALGRRGAYRDYYDLYSIIKDNYASLKSIIVWCRKKFGKIFSERMFLEQLTYFGDAKADRKLKFLSGKYIAPKELATFFKKEIRMLRAKKFLESDK